MDRISRCYRHTFVRVRGQPLSYSSASQTNHKNNVYSVPSITFHPRTHYLIKYVTNRLSILAVASNGPSGLHEEIKVAGSPDGFLEAQLEQVNAMNITHTSGERTDLRISKDAISKATAAGNDKIAGNLRFPIPAHQ